MSQEIAALQVVIEAQTAAFTKGIQDAQNQLKNLNNVAQNSNSGISKISESFSGLSGAFFKFNQASAAVGAALGLISTGAKKLESFFYAADASKKFELQLKELIGSAPRAADMMQRIFDVASQGDVSLTQAKNSIKRLVEATTELGLSNKQIAGLTTTFFQLGKLGGKSAEEMSGAFNQFAVSLQRGEINAGQLNRMLRTSPSLVKNLGDALGKSSQELQKMAKDGQLTSDVIVKAFEKMGPEVASKVDKLPKTVSEGLEQMGRVLSKFQVDLAKAFNFHEMSKGLGEPLEALANTLQTKIFPNILAFAKDISANFEYVKAAALGLAVAFSGPLVAGIAAATKAALAFAATPVGAIIAIGAAIVVLAANWKEVRSAINEARISLLEFLSSSASKLGLDETAAKLKKMADEVRGVEAAYKAADSKEAANGIKDVGDEANKAVPRLNALQSAFASWVEGLTKAKTELDQTPQKIAVLKDMIDKARASAESPTKDSWILKLENDLKALEVQLEAGDLYAGIKRSQDELIRKSEDVKKALSKAASEGADSTVIKKLQAELDSVKAQLDSGDIFKGLMTSMDQAVTKVFELQEALDNATQAGAPPQVLNTLLAQLEQAKLALEDSNSPFFKLEQQLKELPHSAEYIVEAFRRIDEAVAKGFDPDKAKKMKESIEDFGRAGKPILDEIGVAMGNLISDGVKGLVDSLFTAGQSFSQFAQNFLTNIAKMITQMLILKAIQQSMKGTSLGSFFGFAKGGAFDGSTGLPYGVYDKPTLFPMPSPGLHRFATGGTFAGTGMLGEAGPEAILPLRRGTGGKLGVQAAPANTTINVINKADTQIQVSETNKEDGSKQIDILIEKKVKEMIAGGSLDKPLSTSYGLSRKGY